MKKYHFFHVFTDNRDNYSDTLSEARKIYRTWKREGYANLRIYGVITDEQEDYIQGEGMFPY